MNSMNRPDEFFLGQVDLEPNAVQSDQPATRTRIVRSAAAVLLTAHGVVHLLGVPLQWKLAELGDLRYADAYPAPGTPAGIVAGALWLLAGVLFFAGAALVVRGDGRWRTVVLLAAAVLSPLVIANASTAMGGVVVDAALVIACLVTRRRRPW
ncbi:hypothetical protein [Amycolatopsis sp. H20-H5]|uniref:hypothetical protein n=1 Tax=Amycolatopsis sp. H20-H5 TaxID=3046309 RepID=UPI002DB853CE|nr:hypothetical protein [Amycolatopsis sp. H20-H5]MEC3982687.1 hypothetical protein [Amycolatopsis sp. H20-H5]